MTPTSLQTLALAACAAASLFFNADATAAGTDTVKVFVLAGQSNMEHFINDVRKDLGSPSLPFVIGVMGQNGSKPAKGAMLTIQEAQLAMEKIPDFEGNVKAVRTDVLIDKAAEALYPTWKENFEEWEKTGSDRGYHYLGSAIWNVRMGRAFAEAMLELMDD